MFVAFAFLCREVFFWTSNSSRLKASGLFPRPPGLGWGGMTFLLAVPAAC